MYELLWFIIGIGCGIGTTLLFFWLLENAYELGKKAKK